MSEMNTDQQRQHTSEMAFAIHNVLVKELSFETPENKTMEIFRLEWKPKLDLDLQMSSQELEPELYEVVIHLTLTVKLPPEDKVAFLIEVKQAGLFGLKGFTPAQLERILATSCPEVLFPYAREAVSSTATRGGFPHLALPPVNFEAMYQQHLANQQEGGEGQSGSGQMANSAMAEEVIH